MQTCIVQSPLGYTKIRGDRNGIASVSVLDTKEKVTDVIPLELEDCAMQLNEYFEGRRQEFSLKLNPQGTPFQKKVWKQLQLIPYGSTISYLKLSQQLGNTKASRAVANANAKNPLWIIVPCHRVIGSNGSLTGYAGGLHRKQWLLEHESPFKQPTLF